MSKIVKQSPFFVALMLNGCSSGFQSGEVSMDPDTMSTRSIVVTRTHAPHTTLLGEYDTSVTSVWQNISLPGAHKEGMKYQFSSGFLSGAFSNPLQERMVVPGTYQLKEMTYKIGGTKYNLSFSKNSNITFKAYPGEVVYIGDIKVINPKGGERGLELVDNIAQAEADLNSDLPGLNKPLVKRLIEGIK